MGDTGDERDDRRNPSLRGTVRELEEQLRRLSINDARCLESLNRADGSCADVATLDPHAAALVRLGVLVAMDGPAPAFEWATASAIAAGATPEEVVGVLTAAAPLVGSSHIVATAPRIAQALGYDIDAQLEGVRDPVG